MVNHPIIKLMGQKRELTHRHKEWYKEWYKGL